MSVRPSRAGSMIPDVELAELRDSVLVRLRSPSLFDNKRIVLFALPGAFTPTCSTDHVPGYVSLVEEFRKARVDEVICLSVNDPYVMDAWQKSQNAAGVRFIADPLGAFTQAMGMLTDQGPALGSRSWRYSMLVNSGVIETMFIEPDVGGDPFGVSDAQTMLTHLDPNYTDKTRAFLLARHGCPHCARAKKFLEDANISYEAIHIGDELSMRGVKAAAWTAKVPQIFIDGKLIGGADQLERHLATRSD